MNVKDYLDRINYNGSLEPNLDNLKALSIAHKATVPYSNLSLHGGPYSALDVEKFYEKVVTQRGGGICYELNYLFMWLLKQLGYKVFCVQGAFYKPITDGFTRSHHHLLPWVELEGELHFVDPGWHTTGPMKFDLMVPHTEPTCVYRIRQVVGKSGQYYIERHKKTVLDAEGKLLKQGPGITPWTGNYCNDECAKEESDHWRPQLLFDMKPQELDEFEECNDYHHFDKNAGLQNRLIMHLFIDNHFLVTLGESYADKYCPDPNTFKVLSDFAFENDTHVVQIAKKVFKCEVDHPVCFFRRKHYKQMVNG